MSLSEITTVRKKVDFYIDLLARSRGEYFKHYYTDRLDKQIKSLAILTGFHDDCITKQL